MLLATVPRVRHFHYRFPLTPALSLREREARRPILRQPDAPEWFERRARILPLPEGEGRGEGEERVELAGEAANSLHSTILDFQSPSSRFLRLGRSVDVALLR